MHYLEKIRLGNIRRFADGVNIPVSRGATIFLAPNGTGKTSLFEAIELSLTGQVRHQTTSLDFLIRDKMLEAFAESHFSGNIACQATLRKGEVPTMAGDQHLLFPDIDPANLPYLLRLTHLLPQRGTDWLVQAKSEEAASLLDKLPIGRDAMRASGNMTKIKRGFTDLVRNAEQDLNNIEKNIATWTALLTKKDISLQALQSDLKPKEDILRLLNNIIGPLKGVEDVPSSDLTLLRAKCAELIRLLEIQVGADRSKFQALASLADTPKEYKGLTERYSQIEAELKAKQSALTAANTRHAELQKILEGQTEKLGEESANLVRIRQWENLKADLQRTERELIDLDAAIKLTGETIQQLQKTHLTEQDKQQAELQVRELHHQIDVAAEALVKESQELAAALVAINQWRELETKLAQLETERNRLIGQQASVKAHSATLEAQRIANEKAHLTALNQHSALTTAIDAIKSAVVIIVQRLPSDSTSCPVCLANYEPATLRARMEEALRRIEPGLDEANKTLVAAKQALDDSVDALSENKVTLASLDQSLLQVEAQIQSLQDELGAIRVKFAGMPGPEEAEAANNKKTVDNETAMRNNTGEKMAAPPPMGATEWALLVDSLAQINTQIKNAEKDLRKTSMESEKHRARTSELKKMIEDSKPGTETAVEKEGVIRELELALQKSNNDILTSRIEVDKLQIDVNQTTRQFKEIKTNRDLLQAGWTGAGLGNIPDSTTLDSAIEENKKSISTAEANMIAVQQEEVELAKWTVAEEIRQVDIDIDKMRGESTIPLFTEQLSVARVERQQVLDTLRERERAFHQFEVKLAGQLKQIQDYILTINAPWKELLARVVLDPRFAETHLRNYTYYKKQHAEVKVPLHGEEIDAKLVASEAQITDLQFTFLLAMALNNQWAPWKALLLDDPTQHHDLVHAASVFDLLRDYIVDHQFQVLLATHDSVHANFFLRKLQNDGIPANLIQLHAAREGVIAELVAV